MSQHVWLRPVSARAIEVAKGDHAFVEVLQWDLSQIDPAALERIEPMWASIGGAMVEVPPVRERARAMAAALSDAGLDAETDLGATHHLGVWWHMMGVQRLFWGLGIAELDPLELGALELGGAFDDGGSLALSPEQVGRLHAAVSIPDVAKLVRIARERYRAADDSRHELLRMGGTEDEAAEAFPKAFARFAAAVAEAASRKSWLLFWVL